MKKTIYVIAFSILFLSACKNDKKQTESHDASMEETNMHQQDEHSSMDNSSMQGDLKSTTEKNSSSSEIIDAYLQLKNALTEDSKDKAAEAGNKILTAFSNFDMTKLSDEQHMTYMEIMENSKEHAEHIIKSPIDHQREHFEELSKDVNDLIELIGTDKTLYVDFCPMYNNNKGAMWLSETETIKNPYLGSNMPTCGNIQKKIN
ncbi:MULTISPECIES: DUF3347 domain-containing protein [Lutibacter]|jgi:hypothetical protein|uniref:DUF3347 domain-containing protein n=1 Tax=Lutibacter flavus TaxID=691689 RepID=A0A238YDA4_9FLAO|nr:MULTISPECIES: DUF3347 domain-containing protein [Lutibacter]NLP59027.1 DUF3347 domain-containing protein [Lutibacter sp. B1]SNR68952.1 Protein of unknown function [Lutibacter flavus]